MDRARLVLADREFRELLREQGVQTIPNSLSEIEPKAPGGSKSKGEERLDAISLEFVVAWKFFFPLMGISAIEVRLERTWPGFIGQLKDAFITLVTEGPFAGRSRRLRCEHLIDWRPI